MTIMYLQTGHAYRVADGLTAQQINDQLNTNPNRFVEVPLAANSGDVPGTPGMGLAIQRLFITPASVSHFVVI